MEQTQTPTQEVDKQQEKTSLKKTGKSVGLTTPWKPSRVLEIPAHLKKKGFTYRWASKNMVGRIQKLLSEGWVVDEDLSKAMSQSVPKTILDGSPLDGTVQRRELIVMRIPDELAKARNKYYADKASGAAAQPDKDLTAIGKHPQTRKDLIYGEVQSSD